MTPVVPASAGVLVELAECVCRTVAEEGAGPLCWCGLYPGGVPTWDYCGECDGGACGIGYVSVAAIQPYQTFGAGAVGATCAYGLQAVVRIGTVRCLPVVQEGLPDPEALAETALMMHVDAYAMRKAVACCLPASTILTAWAALPATGGCTGGEWTAIVDLEA